jgi:DNA-directed RNA polymerase specialized sigma24 family protein
MLIDETRTRELLDRIVRRLTADAALWEDLRQESLIHLWLLEERRPGQSRSWYLQSCRFHLQNYLAAGKSVDSLKRKRSIVPLSGEDVEFDSLVDESEWDTAVIAQVSAQDIISQLAPRLSTFERLVLFHLAYGLKAREIAVRLKVSHPTIIKHRRRIAALAIRIGIPPFPKRLRHSPWKTTRVVPSSV